MESTEMLAYFAGLIDGEGHLGIKRDPIKGRGVNPVFQERLAVGSTSKAILELLAQSFGCGQVSHRLSKSKCQEWWVWDVTAKQAVRVIEQIYPYLRIKKCEADLVLALSASRQPNRVRLSVEAVTYRESLYQRLKSLHHHPVIT